MNFDVKYMLSIIPHILSYLPVTLLISLLSILLATALGIIFALLLRAGKGAAGFAHLYISFFRGTPVLVQLLIIYFGLPQIFPALNSMSAMNAVILGLSLNTSAYLAEIFRAAIDSVDKGQLEASLASGLSLFQASWRILLPQACRNAIPATGNVYIGLIKNSSLAFTLGVSELLAAGKLAATESLKYFEAYFAVGLIYWGLTIILSELQRRLEKQINKPYVN
ncbi:amino acid ABC transporter permease [Rouxiella badensis]|jgi:putative amino-acid transport system permease protein|uniref:ABC transporter permease n=1 Tax=Rouxiella badensis TaxID=1646377 RepID=A0A1X0WF62_9GAMM|nr:amino acid ABC transporter permease [Rouxiella badensis]MCC3701848.1 amino acid ABC transporter permease [Rouxiella badensis]MCC3719965.1 amino acid ABC transporter permease [Rouxiella badensis]MCC3729628.1 amino acid ABC transporter permease [Rouxiella badensis]MCC3731489.1 amino acid ABC transporter permease [Rouxiella badensis]MCC3738424.1 amino acid ABC transporter permease [Rouxiella badensis]